ncbi:MAG: SMC-Scp complex subunit ScpB [Thermoanaerobaculia bacterium]
MSRNKKKNRRGNAQTVGGSDRVEEGSAVETATPETESESESEAAVESEVAVDSDVVVESETRGETDAAGEPEAATASASDVPAEIDPESADAEVPETPDAATLAAVAAVEAMLYASGKPAPIERLAEAAELSVENVEAALTILARLCDDPGRGVRLDRVAGGVRLVSRPEFDYPVRRLLGLDGKNKLSMAALETLAIMAYRQPVTAPEVAELRGVNSASSIRTLLDRKLITTAGRKEVVGTPFLYKTTKEFLVHFGLTDLKELPKPEELESLYGIETPGVPDPSQTELFAESDVDGTAENEAEETAGESHPSEIPLAEASADAAAEDHGAPDAPEPSLATEAPASISDAASEPDLEPAPAQPPSDEETS